MNEARRGSDAQAIAERLDSGLAALALVANYYRIAADPAQLRHQLGADGTAGGGGRPRSRHQSVWQLKSRIIRGVTAKRLGAIPYPAILELKDGGFAILAVAAEKGKVRLVDPIARIAKEMTLEEAQDLSSGSAILVTRRLGGAGVDPDTFGFRWFWPSILRYRRPLAHVLVRLAVRAALRAGDADLLPARGRQGAGPQGHVDAGRAHRRHGDAQACSRPCCSSSASYTLSHTTNRIDVELGRRLFHHLFRLPLAYFETRAAGQTVARMRELETIRSFLTGQGLTALLDLVFTLVFIGVMFIYSVKLTLVVLISIPVYVLIAAVLRPILREQINERFNRGARSQQFLVELIVGAQTLKAASVEPMMQAQWEERLASYVSKSFDAGVTGALRPEHDPVREQGHDGADPVHRRAIGDRGLDVGRRAHRLQHDCEPGRAADPAAVAALAGFPAGAGVGGAARRHPQLRRRSPCRRTF